VRSRRMLMDALASLLKKRSSKTISVQEIADEATLNRATFTALSRQNALLQAHDQRTVSRPNRASRD